VAEEEVVWVEQLVVVDGEGAAENAAKADDLVGYCVAYQAGLVGAGDLARVVEVPGLWEMAVEVVAEALVLPYFHQNQR
jgi:hypothetical protein